MVPFTWQTTLGTKRGEVIAEDPTGVLYGLGLGVTRIEPGYRQPVRGLPEGFVLSHGASLLAYQLAY